MDFARKELEKYGWCEGKGLGRNEDGISSALKPKLKFDNAGLGHDIGEQYKNNWWEKVFNSAAESIDVEVNDTIGVRMKLKSDDSIDISTRGYPSKHRKKDGMEYGSFLKVSTLTEKGVERYSPMVDDDLEASPTSCFKALTDEELFAACGGRTAHKGARHGLKLNGKLCRIAKQEKMLLKKMRKVSLSDDNEKEKSATEKKLKKLKKQKEHTKEKYIPIMEDSMESVSSNGLRKKKKRKSVSFSETVTVTKYVVDNDTSFESSSTKDENSNEQNLEGIASGSDEGIEQDIENNNNDIEDNHRSFEVAQFKISDLSKAERKKLKKKRKLESRKNTQTGLFLQRLNDDEFFDEESPVDVEERINLKKRKHHDEFDNDDSKSGYSVTESPGRYQSKKNKRKKKKQKKMDERISSITRSLDNVCRISESE